MNLFTEYPEKNEQELNNLVIEQVKKQIQKLYGDKPSAKRDTHAKTHGAIKGSLEIFDFDEEAIKRQLVQTIELSADKIKSLSLKQGLLAQAKQYPVWIRFANGRTTVENDYVADTRSMSVKIIGVEGERLKTSHELRTQDIITQNTEIFFIKNIQYYYEFFKSVVDSPKAALIWLLTHPQQFLALQKMTGPTPKSLLTEKYWSGSAFSLGLKSDFDESKPGHVPVEYPAVVKFAFTPVSPQAPHEAIPFQSRAGIPKLPFIDRAKALGFSKDQPDNYYRDDLIQKLKKPDAQYCWDFGIQFQANTQMSIDDVTVLWPEEQSQFFTVGRLTVNHQIMDSQEQLKFGENIQISIWNGLTVHRPVGALNRLRSLVYPIVADYRHQRNNVNYQEPTGDEIFN
ncbi:hypothetical protein [Gloeothece verrucosa]|uniref:Catalase n=1 Tax=Gloeothece verrucosa (strain PCC 7822) TaxID=497965 RepID=E0U7G5_GLOV7|nr:hypothetical protein [Gloeothece verrucosa]ADN13661.1 conserved hypothetical protein [Gloeothece verrucosa PCC 7822]